MSAERQRVEPVRPCPSMDVGAGNGAIPNLRATAVIASRPNRRILLAGAREPLG